MVDMPLDVQPITGDGDVRVADEPHAAEHAAPPVDGPTQARHPWRATARTVFAAVVALLSLLPMIAATAGVDTVPAVAQFLAVVATVTRVLASPAIEGFLKQYLPFLAAEPK